MNPVVAYMRVNKIEMTREAYIALAFAGDEPTVEDELAMPHEFRSLDIDVRVHVYVDGRKVRNGRKVKPR